jgi:hypothetical protein
MFIRHEWTYQDKGKKIVGVASSHEMYAPFLIRGKPCSQTCYEALKPLLGGHMQRNNRGIFTIGILE